MCCVMSCRGSSFTILLMVSTWPRRCWRRERPQCRVDDVASARTSATRARRRSVMANNNDPEPDGAELLKVLKPMIRFSARLERGTVDLARPRTEIARLKKRIDTSLDGLDGAALVSSLRGLLREITPE